MRRKIAAILAADIAGYSRLVAEDEEETIRRLAAYREVFDDFIRRYGGRIFNTAGDSVLAEFPSAVDALRCAIDVQESLRTRNMAYPPSRQMTFRMGLTIGDVIERDGDLLGDGVNIAARLQTLAKPGGVCLSKSVYDAVANKLSVRYSDMGAQQVKNIPYPVHTFSVAVGGDKEEKKPDPKQDTGQGEEKRDDPSPSRFGFVGMLAGALVAGALVAVGASHFLKSDEPKKPDKEPASVVATIEKKPAAEKPIKTEPADNGPAKTIPVEINDSPAAKKQDKEQVKTAPVEQQPVKQAKIDPVEKAAPSIPDLPPKTETTQPVKSAPQRDDDVAGQQRLRQRRWAECEGSDTDRALPACETIIQDAGDNGAEAARALRSMALVYRRQSKFDDAIESYTQSLALVADASAYDGRGIANLMKNLPEKALEDFDQAIKLDGNMGEAYNNRAWTYYKNGRTKEALTDANRAVALLPEKAYVWDTRAHINEALGNRKQALEDFQKAVGIDGSMQSSADGVKRLQ